MTITAAGVYDIEIETYHHDPNLCDGPSISSSGLRAVMECPAKFYATYCGNPKRFPPRESAALDMGKAVHSLVLGEPEFAKYFIVSHYDDFRKKEAQTWRDHQDRTVIKADQFDVIRAMADAQLASPQVARAFEQGKPEKSLVWKDEETGIWIKVRPDWLPDDPTQRFITEYKSAASIDPRRFSSAAFELGYHVQAAMQIDAVQTVLGVKPLGVAHVVQEKDVPYLAELRMFGPEAIEDGRLQYRLALKRFAACLRLNEWPGYTTEASYIEMPFWHASKMETVRDGLDNYNGTEAAGRKYEAGDYIAAG